MNYKVFKDTVIKILNQYSNQGSITPDTDGNVQDALLRIPVFANIGQIEIATTAKYIIKTINKTEEDMMMFTNNNGYYDYTLPADYFNLVKIENDDDILNWKSRSRNVIGIKYPGSGSVDIIYYAYPTNIPDDVDDSFVFDIDEEACHALCFYVASQIWIDDVQNKGVSARLFAIYQGKLANMISLNMNGHQGIRNTMFTGCSNKKLY